MAVENKIYAKRSGGEVRPVDDHSDEPGATSIDSDGPPFDTPVLRPDDYEFSVAKRDTADDTLSPRSQVSAGTILPEPYDQTDISNGVSQADLLDRSFGANAGITDADGLGIVPHYRLIPSVVEDVSAKVRSGWSRNTAGRVVNLNGLYESVASDTPRLQYDFNGNPSGLLVEAAGRTNQVLNAANPSAWTSAGTNGVTFNDKTSLHADEGSNGDVDAKEVVGGGAADDHIQESAGTFTGIDEVVYVKAEKTSSDKIGLEVRNTTSGNVVALLEYEYSTDTITTVSGSVAGEDFRKKTDSGPNSGKTVHFQFRIAGGNSENVNGENRVIRVYPDRNANANGTIHHHAQIEEAPNASSPIVTGGSATTRAGDDYSIFTGGQPSWWNDSEMTIMITFEPRFYYTSFFDLLTFGSNGELRVGDSGTLPTVFRFSDSGGTAGGFGSAGDVSGFTEQKVAFSFNGSEVRLSRNGNDNTNSYDGSWLNCSSLTLSDEGFYRFASVIALPRMLSVSTLNTLTS